ncbi:hypothetical protein COV11_01260 [Candidatus Woesearchaeota archaeon CG10_big_fil_rev_8_21_14_0_10_30_7]|nr:MAG: hypothetical protein COV11_01260 [Candidatus Woesearchaeota archaeon CG10_big_fil_rev_8_21_14_0_10_30_7]
MSYKTNKLKTIMQGIASNVILKDEFKEVNTVAGFDVSFTNDNKVVCAVVVFDAKTLDVIEVKKVIKDSPMPFIPGFLAFRKGPAMLEAYYSLDNEPDLLFIEGTGILHEEKCGLATYLGVELEKPTIGVSAKINCGEIKGEDIIFNGEFVGKVVKTREYANPLYVSPGNLITIETAAKLVKEFIIPPHKMPEPIHKAHRAAKKKAKFIQENGHEEVKKEEEVSEYDMDKKTMNDLTVGTY